MAVAFIDALGYAFRFLLPFPSKTDFQPADIRKILVIRLDHLGDVVMTRPAIAALHVRYPGARIDLLVAREFAPLFEDMREIREVISFTNHWFRTSGDKNFLSTWDETKSLIKRFKKERYDLAVDFRGDLRHILLMAFAGIPRRVAYGITGGGFLLTSTKPYDRKKHQVLVNNFLISDLTGEAGAGQFSFPYSGSRKWRFWNAQGKALSASAKARIIMHPAAGYPSKCWPLEKYRELIAKILSGKHAMQIILIGTEADQKLFPVEEKPEKLTDLRGKTTLADLPVLFDACQVYVGNDSGPAHLAAAQGMHVISIFSGTNDPDVWRPWTDRLQLVRHAVPCSPCEALSCPLGHHDCMTKIGVDEVYEKVGAALAATGLS